jgi:hypothetical protein
MPGPPFAYDSFQSTIGLHDGHESESKRNPSKISYMCNSGAFVQVCIFSVNCLTFGFVTDNVLYTIHIQMLQIMVKQTIIHGGKY